MEEKTALLELNEKNDMLAVNVVCPVEGNKYMTHTRYVIVSCAKCGTSFRTDFDQSIYDKVAKKLNSLLAYNNKVIILATEKYEPDITHIKEHYTQMKCWRVSDLTPTMDEHKRCLKCGICRNCFTCTSCGQTFLPNKNRRKQQCPHCKSNQFTHTYLKEVNEEGKTKICPHCKSDDIVMTRTTNKTKCHKCGTTKLSETKSRRAFSLEIKRHPGYEIE